MQYIFCEFHYNHNNQYYGIFLLSIKTMSPIETFTYLNSNEICKPQKRKAYQKKN